MRILLAAFFAVAALAVGVAIGATQLGGDADRAAAQVPPAPSESAVKNAGVLPEPGKTATPRTAERRADCRRDELSDSSADNRDAALANDGCGAKSADDEKSSGNDRESRDPTGDDGAGSPEETGPDEALGPDDRGNDP